MVAKPHFAVLSNVRCSVCFPHPSSLIDLFLLSASRVFFCLAQSTVLVSEISAWSFSWRILQKTELKEVGFVTFLPHQINCDINGTMKKYCAVLKKKAVL